MNVKANHTAGMQVNFPVRLNETDADNLNDFIEAYGPFATKADMMRELFRVALNAEPGAIADRPPREVIREKVKEKVVYPSRDQAFVAKFPHSQKVTERIKDMRETMADKYGRLGDDDILIEFVKRFEALEDERAFLVEPPKRIRDEMIEAASPMIESGDAKSVGHWLTMFFRGHYKKPQSKPAEPAPKPKKKGFSFDNFW